MILVKYKCGCIYRHNGSDNVYFDIRLCHYTDCQSYFRDEPEIELTELEKAVYEI